MRSYHLNIEVVLKSQMPVSSICAKGGGFNGRRVGGYFQVLGCTAVTFEDVRNLLVRHVKEEPFLIGYEDVIDEIAVDDIEELRPDEVKKFMQENYGLKALLKDPLEEGIWYESGHGFYYA